MTGADIRHAKPRGPRLRPAGERRERPRPARAEPHPRAPRPRTPLHALQPALALVVLSAALGSAAVPLEPLDAKNGVGDLAFGAPPAQFRDLLSWGQQDDLAVYVGEMNPEVAGIRFETRLLRFWQDHLVEVELLTTDIAAARSYFKLMVQTYGRPTNKLGANSYQWVGSLVLASYAENGKTASVTYGSVTLLKERQRQSKKR